MERLEIPEGPVELRADASVVAIEETEGVIGGEFAVGGSGGEHFIGLVEFGGDGFAGGWRGEIEEAGFEGEGAEGAPAQDGEFFDEFELEIVGRGEGEDVAVEDGLGVVEGLVREDGGAEGHAVERAGESVGGCVFGGDGPGGRGQGSGGFGTVAHGGAVFGEM